MGACRLGIFNQNLKGDQEMTLSAKNPIDAHVGGQVRLRRVVVGMTQTELAKRLGITFQQVQKYEKGTNRIGASRLYLIAEILNVQVQSLFEGVDAVVENSPGAFEGARDERVERIEKLIRSPGGVDLCKAFVNIKDLGLRKQITALVKSIAATG